jgi:hypothetical protein
MKVNIAIWDKGLCNQHRNKFIEICVFVCDSRACSDNNFTVAFRYGIVITVNSLIPAPSATWGAWQERGRLRLVIKMVQLNCIWRWRRQAQGCCHCLCQTLREENICHGSGHLSPSLPYLIFFLCPSLPLGCAQTRSWGLDIPKFIGAENCYSSIKQNIDRL